MGDLISREAILKHIEKIRQDALMMDDLPRKSGIMNGMLLCEEAVRNQPAAQPPLEEFEWCTDCKEYDQKAHCCHRFTKVIRQTVEELKVVRCKDCIHNNACEIQYAAQTGEWFYCGYGERGEQNG